MKNNRIKFLSLLLIFVIVFSCFSFSYGETKTDEIEKYEIDAFVEKNSDLLLTYSFEWKVLEDLDTNIPLIIGLPNYNASVNSASDVVDSYTVSNGNVEFYFKRNYKKGETISFDFNVTVSNMYQISKDGQTACYYFTPGWFDNIEVKKLVINWISHDPLNWSSGATLEDKYLIWETSLSEGERFSIEVSYNIDAYDFSSGGYDPYYPYYPDYPDYPDSPDFGIVGTIFSIIPLIFLIAVISYVKKAVSSYDSESGFATGETKTKITRTKIEYYDECPGCGAPRQKDAELCPYCGRNLVKSEEVLKEEEIKDEDKEALKYKSDGLFPYSHSPNTYVRVNVVHVPTSHSSSSSHSSHTGSRGGGCVHSSCACACACASCACACACAGGGRAGCSVKDFYNTKLKLEQLKRRNK